MLKKLLKDKLNAKYQGVLKKLTPKGLELLVDKLSTKVTTEDELEDFVNGLENTLEVFVDVIQSETDRRIKEEVDKTKKKVVQSVEDENEEEDKSKIQPEVPEWAKGLVSSVESLKAQLATEKGKNAKGELIEAAKAKGIPAKLAEKYVIGENFDKDAALTELESDWAEITQFKVNSSVESESNFVPKLGDEKAVSSAIKDFAKKNVEQNTQKV